MTKNKRRTLRGRQKGRRVCRQSTARIWGKLYSYGGGYMLRTRIYTAHFSVLVLPLWVVIRRYSPAFTGKLLSADKRSISILLSLSGGLPSRRARKGEKSFNPGSSPDTSPKFFRRTHSRQSLSLAVSGLCLCLVPRDVHPAYWTQLYHPGKRRQRAGKKEIRALLSRFRSTKAERPFHLPVTGPGQSAYRRKGGTSHAPGGQLAKRRRRPSRTMSRRSWRGRPRDPCTIQEWDVER